MGPAMKKHALLLSLFLVILISMQACDASSVATPAAGVQASPQISTLVSIGFYATTPALPQAAPVATDGMTVTLPPATAGTLMATATPRKTG